MEKMSLLHCKLDLEKVQHFKFYVIWEKSLDIRLVSPLVIVVCPVTMFCISWVTMYVANDAAKHLICSWNHHRILRPQGCVPVENVAQTSCVVQLPAKLIPTVNEVVRMCEERGGSLARDATLGTDPLVMRADLIKSCERLCFSTQPAG